MGSLNSLSSFPMFGTLFTHKLLLLSFIKVSCYSYSVGTMLASIFSQVIYFFKTSSAQSLPPELTLVTSQIELIVAEVWSLKGKCELALAHVWLTDLAWFQGCGLGQIRAGKQLQLTAHTS